MAAAYHPSMSAADADTDLDPVMPAQTRRARWLRRFVLEAALDAILVISIVLLLGVIQVPQPFPFGIERAPILSFHGATPLLIAWLSAMIVLANRFARPVVVAILGRFVLRSLGLLVVVVNAITIWLATLLVPDFIVVASPNVLWVLVAATLYTVGSTVLMTLLGLNRPSAVAVGGGPLWQLLEAIPTPRRNSLVENLRLQQVYDAIYATSLDVALDDTPVGDVRRWSEANLLGEPSRAQRLSAPARMRGLLQDLGPTYVKIGQMLASRRDLLPAEWTDELSKLQSEARPFPWDDAREILESELKRPVESLFASIEQEPFAAASTAQVHRAVTVDGREVAVKVQRPRILAKTKADLGVIQELAAVAEPRFASLAPSGPRACRGVRGRCPRGAGLPQRGLPGPPAGRRHEPGSPTSISRSSTTTCRAPGS